MLEHSKTERMRFRNRGRFRSPIPSIVMLLILIPDPRMAAYSLHLPGIIEEELGYLRINPGVFHRSASSDSEPIPPDPLSPPKAGRGGTRLQEPWVEATTGYFHGRVLPFEDRITTPTALASLRATDSLAQVSATEASAYSLRLRRAVDLVRQVIEGAPIIRLERLGSLLPPTETLYLNSQKIETDNYWLPSAIAEIYEEHDFKARTQRLMLLEARLIGMREHADLATTTHEIDAGPLRKKAVEVLQSPEYRWRSQSPLLQTLKDYVRRALSRIVDFLRPSPSPAPLAEWFLRLLLLVLALFLGFSVTRRLRRVLLRPRVPMSSDETSVPTGQFEYPVDLLLDRANSAARAQDLRSAVRFFFLASLAALRQSGHLRWRSSATNNEYLRELDAEGGALASIFHRLTQVYERFWYGKEPIDQESYQAFERTARNVIAMRDPAS